jgi:hypothetical protein
MKTHRYRLLLGIVSIVVLSSCRLFVKEPTLDPTFDNLGVDTDLGARLDANGNLIPDGVNPLGAGAGAIDPLDEIIISILDRGNDTITLRLIDYAGSESSRQVVRITARATLPSSFGGR